MLIITKLQGKNNIFKIWRQCILEYFCTPKKRDDSVAQLVEHYTFNVGVLGSNPSGITKEEIKKLQIELKALQNQAFAGFFIFCNYQIKAKNINPKVR
jgi:hypothetical protein